MVQEQKRGTAHKERKRNTNCEEEVCPNVAQHRYFSRVPTERFLLYRYRQCNVMSPANIYPPAAQPPVPAPSDYINEQLHGAEIPTIPDTSYTS